jgi:predicted ATP-grasp superfamily ATP-dependent carboligase
MAAQGYAMVTAALRAFASVPGHHVVVLHDARIPADALPAHTHIPVGPMQWRTRLLRATDDVQAVLVIAPETGGVLADLTAEVEARGRRVLGCSAAGIRTAQDKLLVCAVLARAGVPVPYTVEIPLSSDPAAILAVLPLPVVLKPRVGAGGEGVLLVRGVRDLAAGVERVRRATKDAETCLVQEYVKGVPASVSLLTDGRRARPLTLNRQLIGAGRQLTYRGGEVPFDHPQRDAAFAMAETACAAIPGLVGYVGVDVILGDRGPVVIEINPRWTTSCAGIQQVLNVNLGKAVLNAVLRHVLPQNVQTTGRVRFDQETLRREFQKAARAWRTPGTLRKR